MKRSGPLRRRVSLRRTIEAARAFEQRGRGGLDRGKALTRKRPQRPREGPLTARAWRREAFRLSGGRCILTGTRAASADDKRFHVHHPLPAGTLRDLGLHEHVWDPRNALWVAGWRHMAHEGASRRIPRWALSERVWEFCREMDALGEHVGLGPGWATARVERAHPAAGLSGVDERSDDGEG